MAAVEMVEDPISKKPAGKDTVAKIFQAICDEGVLLRASGNNFILSPSLIINKDHVNKIITAMDKGFSIF